jgi:hypothetical protein
MARIDDFRAQLVGGGARPSQFRVSLMFPSWVNAGNAGASGQFLVKAASLPASVITPIEVPFRGRIAKIAGERQFANWNVTVLNDSDFLIRNALETWSNGILAHTSTNGRLAPLDYAVNLYVSQLDRNDLVIKEYRFANCFPQNISEIQLDFGATNQIQEFQCEFSVDFWEVINGPAITS